MKTRQAKQTGFTLVELLVVMGLLSGFMIVLTDISVATLDVQKESAATSVITQDGRFMMARLSYDIQRASSITTPAGLGGTGNTLAIVISGVTNTYTLNGTNLQLVNASGTHVLNSPESTISAWNVQRLGNAGGKDTIRLSFTVTSVTQDDQGKRSQVFTSTVGRRQ